MESDGGLPPTHGWPIPISNSFSAIASPGRIPTPLPSTAIAHPTKDMMKSIDINILFIFSPKIRMKDFVHSLFGTVIREWMHLKDIKL
jgi:hypothetical protein